LVKGSDCPDDLRRAMRPQFLIFSATWRDACGLNPPAAMAKSQFHFCAYWRAIESEFTVEFPSKAYRDPDSGIIVADGYDVGDIIGYRKDGSPINLIGGGAEIDFTKWIPEEWDSAVTQRVNQISVVERFGDRHPMRSATRSVPRSIGMGVDYITKGTAYGEDTTAADEVLLTARKFGKAVRIADEDMNDTLPNVIAAKQVDWATSYAKMFDNATLGCTAVAGAGVPFNSLYYTLTQNGTNTGYLANANITQAATATYDNLSAVLALHETSDFFDVNNSIAIAHPKFRALLRGIKDLQNRPILVEMTSGGATGVAPATLFGFTLKWSLGARTSATATSAPSGHPLLIFGNPGYLKVGVRSGPESAFADADSGAGFLTDDALLKMRARRGFGVGFEAAFSIFDYTGA
jgi:HK97 family phage major capsid protein